MIVPESMDLMIWFKLNPAPLITTCCLRSFNILHWRTDSVTLTPAWYDMLHFCYSNALLSSFHYNCRIPFTDEKVRTWLLCKVNSTTRQFCSVAFIWMVTLTLSITSTDSKVRTTLYSIINSTTGKYCSVAFIWMVSLKDFIHRLKS